jgi:hypothetical protein
MAYTYLLHHIPTDTFYYGVRWAKGYDSSEFWIKYFTSSLTVIPLYRTLFGDESFEFEIRKIFDDKQSAIEWENKVLRRMKVLEHPEKWLNRTNNKAISDEVAFRWTGKTNPKSPELILKFCGVRNGMFGKHHSIDSLLKISLAGMGNSYKLGVKESIVTRNRKSKARSGKRLINNGLISYLICKDISLPVGFVFGRLIKKQENM